jgi:hypothetical protein
MATGQFHHLLGNRLRRRLGQHAMVGEKVERLTFLKQSPHPL